MKCNICGSNTNIFFKGKILKKYEISYFKCYSCGFIQTEKPYWIKEAYRKPIADFDIGLVSRNLQFAQTVGKIIEEYFDAKGRFLDYAGGYGLFVRLMRDKGYDFYRHELYCENIFARFFDIEELPSSSNFELVTALEVFEHFINPINETEKIFCYSDSVLFSTELQPNKKINSTDDWWYFAPGTGQHISFYTYKSLAYIADIHNMNFYSNNTNWHLFTKKTFKKVDFNKLCKKKSIFEKGKSNKSLLEADFNNLKRKYEMD